MEKDNTTVRITVHKQHQVRFLKFLAVDSDHRDDLAHPDLVDLTFHEWNRPECDQFHCEGIPFTGFHDHGESYDPHRMCGDGCISMEVRADRDERLYTLIEESSGHPDRKSFDEVRAFLILERECRELMQSYAQTAVA